MSPKRKTLENETEVFTDDLFLGIDIGASNLKYGIVDKVGKLIYSHSQSTNANKGLEYMLTNLKRLIMSLQEKYPKIKAIGVGIPGMVASDGTVLYSPNLPEWKEVPLAKFLSNVFSLPTIIDNDANVAAYAEMLVGQGKDYNNFIYVTLGTGVGGSIVLNKKIYKGERNSAGEFGHLIFNPNEKLDTERPFRTGVLEEYLGKSQITSYAKKYIKDKPNTLLHTYPKPDPYFISDAAEKGDEVAIEILNYIGFLLGIGLSSVMNFLDINVAIVGGGVSLAPDHFIHYAINTIRQRALPHIAQSVIIHRAFYTKEAGVIGAALMARDYGK